MACSSLATSAVECLARFPSLARSAGGGPGRGRDPAYRNARPGPSPRAGYARSISGSTLGRRFFAARHRSYDACIVNHDSADPPSAAASASAISALTAARPLSTRESATRDTPRRLANSVTVIPPASITVSFNTSPGCGGLYMRVAMVRFFSDSPRNQPDRCPFPRK